MTETTTREWQVRCTRCYAHSAWLRRELDAQTWAATHRCDA